MSSRCSARPSRRPCPWHEAGAGHPGSAFDFAPLDCAQGRQGRKDPGLISLVEAGSSDPADTQAIS